MSAHLLTVEVVFALPARTWRETVAIEAPGTIERAVAESGLARICEQETGQAPAGYGIYGRNVRPTDAVLEGQRVEIYRPLIIDPRARRREREQS